MNHSRRSLLFVAPYKRATMSNSLPTLMIKEGHDLFALFPMFIALSLFHSQKTSDSLEKPMSEFPTPTRTQSLPKDDIF